MFTLKEEGDASFAQDDLLAESPVKSIEHLRQLRTAVLESNVQVSYLFYSPEETKGGVPVFPKPFSAKSQTIYKSGLFACEHCAKLRTFSFIIRERYHKNEWVPAVDKRGIA